MGGLILELCLRKYAPDVQFGIYGSAAGLAGVDAGIGIT